MNLKELKDLGCNRFVIKETIKSNVKGTNTQPTYPREKYRTSPIFCQESKRAVPRHEYVNTKIKACGGKNAKLLFELIDIDCYLASRICPKLYDMHKARFVKINSGEWGAASGTANCHAPRSKTYTSPTSARPTLRK